MPKRVTAEGLATPFAHLTVSRACEVEDDFRSVGTAPCGSKTAKPDHCVDACSVEEFDKSDYIDSLGGRKNKQGRRSCSGMTDPCYGSSI